VREAGYDLPAIMLIASGYERVAVSARRAGIAEYLLKEADGSHLQVLADAVRRVWQARQREAESQAAVRGPRPEEEQLRHLILTDPLTGLYNRRFLREALRTEFEGARRYRYPLACAMMDLDHFKALNDSYGHLVGDEVLQGVAALMRRSFRAPDRCFRYGGEEFTVLMPHTNPEEGRAAWERVLAQLRQQPLSSAAGDIRITASVGLAVYCKGNFLSPEELLAAADAALFAAKRQGRDRIVVTLGAHDPAQALRGAVRAA
jgi:diguanylate cyclase (GGDEF)-like protein